MLQRNELASIILDAQDALEKLKALSEIITVIFDISPYPDSLNDKRVGILLESYETLSEQKIAQLDKCISALKALVFDKERNGNLN